MSLNTTWWIVNFPYKFTISRRNKANVGISERLYVVEWMQTVLHDLVQLNRYGPSVQTLLLATLTSISIRNWGQRQYYQQIHHYHRKKNETWHLSNSVPFTGLQLHKNVSTSVTVQLTTTCPANWTWTTNKQSNRNQKTLLHELYLVTRHEQKVYPFLWHQYVHLPPYRLTLT